MPQIANPVLSNYNPFNIAAQEELAACLPFIATFFIVVLCTALLCGMGQINWLCKFYSGEEGGEG